MGCCKEWDWFVEETGLSDGDKVKIIASGKEIEGAISLFHVGPGYFNAEIYFNIPGEKGVRDYSYKRRKYGHCEHAYDENTERWCPFGVLFCYPDIHSEFPDLHRIEAVYDAKGNRYDYQSFLVSKKKRELTRINSEISLIPDREKELKEQKISLEKEIAELTKEGER